MHCLLQFEESVNHPTRNMNKNWAVKLRPVLKFSVGTSWEQTQGTETVVRRFLMWEECKSLSNNPLSEIPQFVISKLVVRECFSPRCINVSILDQNIVSKSKLLKVKTNKLAFFLDHHAALGLGESFEDYTAAHNLLSFLNAWRAFSYREMPLKSRFQMMCCKQNKTKTKLILPLPSGI